MEPGLWGLDFNPEPIECCIRACADEATFIVKFTPHPHVRPRWYPVCLAHVKSESTCERCPGKSFPRQDIETL